MCARTCPQAHIIYVCTHVYVCIVDIVSIIDKNILIIIMGLPVVVRHKGRGVVSTLQVEHALKVEETLFDWNQNTNTTHAS